MSPERLAGLNDGAVQARIGKLSTIQDDFRVIAADMVHKIPHEWRIRRLVEVARDEGSAVIGEVDGERAYPPSVLDGERPVRQRRHGRGVEPTREQTAQRHVGNDLPPDDVFQQLDDRPDRPR